MKRRDIMFKNSVLKVSVNTQKWLKASFNRAIKTMAQVAVATIGINGTMGAVDWKIVCSTVALSGILSVLTSIAGLPEVESEE